MLEMDVQSIRMDVNDENLVGCVCIGTAEIKPDIQYYYKVKYVTNDWVC